ncbi:3-hydroxyanthranilic acid dioxygenase [Perkinsus chesapeaki]|uniref:3-hydroxyanthranilate 3,4-dioxygenase n=1 Tax=Perkinsus chesapeaki TaxID=330153 RepID=A0A7J6M3F1_PERCH|nr:3-hydroxyanthranilic acid dioxygenase [Perkinsus chesapeaki]
MTHNLKFDGPVSVEDWVAEHSESFSPPICNKLMHKEHLSIMFVGGPNTRTDFHLDESPEFFWQLKGNMNLPIIQQGKKRVIHIKEGEVFLLPGRIPHSPQRPETASLGLVVERARLEGKEFDGLRWYTDFEKCDEVLWEKYFYCGDLGRDLVPIVQEFKASEAFATGKPTPGSVVSIFHLCLRPFSFDEWLQQHSDELAVPGARLNLFGDSHPENGFTVMILGAGTTQTSFEESAGDFEAFLYVKQGEIEVSPDAAEGKTVEAGQCFVLAERQSFKYKRSPDCIAILLKTT